MKRILLILLVCLSVDLLTSQNLVPNASFDTSALSPNYYGQICYPTGWSSPSGYCTVVVGHGSPDYYKVGGTGGAGVPTTFWATVSPRSGAGMAGFATYLPSTLNFREYIRTTLSSPLVVGQTYEISFWLTNGITWLNGHATNNIGVAFTTSPLTQPAAATIAETPDVEYTSVLWDTLWHQLTFLYTATDAAQYMTIGCFRNDADNTIVQEKVLCCPTSSAAYYYIDDVVVQPYEPLPLELLQFTGKAVNYTSELKWTTLNELQTDHFIIERSNDGTLFESIGSVPAAGYSVDTLRYEFTDDAPAMGMNYYRLKQTDINGIYEYSSVIQLRFETGQSFNISPNPSHDKIFINTSLSEEGILEVINESGQILYARQFTGMPVVELDIAELSPGLYFVRCISARGTEIRRFIKL